MPQTHPESVRELASKLPPQPRIFGLLRSSKMKSRGLNLPTMHPGPQLTSLPPEATGPLPALPWTPGQVCRAPWSPEIPASSSLHPSGPGACPSFHPPHPQEATLLPHPLPGDSLEPVIVSLPSAPRD